MSGSGDTDDSFTDSNPFLPVRFEFLFQANLTDNFR